MTAEQDAYARGLLDGKIAIRLDHHDERIAATDLILARTVEIAQSLTSTVQTLTEARVTDAATRVATAEAVKDAKNAQEDQAKRAWSPAAKLIAALGASAAALAILWAVLSSLPSVT